MHKFGIRMFARIGGIQTGLIRENDERIRFNQIGHQCTERIVITHFDFIRGDSIVFVDDGDDFEGQQGAQG